MMSTAATSPPIKKLIDARSRQSLTLNCPGNQRVSTSFEAITIAHGSTKAVVSISHQINFFLAEASIFFKGLTLAVSRAGVRSTEGTYKRSL